jgi:isoquinoline 1-oxidoreductase beta subunit
VLVGDGRVDVWTGDQNPQRILRRAAELTGIAPENVYVHLTFLGGGYGNSGNGPQCEHAVFIANAVKGRPVMTMWTREEDWGTGTKYRPMGAAICRAGLDADGWPIAMDVRSIGGMGQRGLVDPPYWMPNYRCTDHRLPSPNHVPGGTRRGTGAGPNAFYMESFIDELAHAAGKDPYLYRRELIARNPPEPKVRFPEGSGIGGFRYRDDWLRALDMVAKMSQWGTPLPEGWARGIAIDDRRRRNRQGAICAEVHTVEVTRRGQLRLHRVDVAFDTASSSSTRSRCANRSKGRSPGATATRCTRRRASRTAEPSSATSIRSLCRAWPNTRRRSTSPSSGRRNGSRVRARRPSRR